MIFYRLSWIILAHGDCDGICSASLASSARADSKLFFSNPYELLSSLRSIRGENTIIADIALVSTYKDQIVNELKRLNSTGEVIYFDHHPLPSGLSESDLPATVVRGRDDSCTSELVYEYFKDQLGHEISRVAVYGAIGDYSDNTEAIKEILKNWDKRELYLEAGILIAVLEGTKKKDYEFKRGLASYLSRNGLPSLNDDLVKIAIQESKIDEEMRLVVKRNVRTLGNVAYVQDIPWSLAKSATYARAYGKAMVGVAAEPMGEYMDMSLRSVDQNNLHQIVPMVAESLNGVGGGHKNAAGARVPVGRFMQFISKLNEAISIQSYP